MNEELLKQLKNKYEALGENPETYLKGLLHSKPLNYWDYIEVDTLLSLQKPKTDFKDETVFIIYHQITELTLKLMIHEAQQITELKDFTEEEIFMDKLKRLMRYTDMLITSFDVMKDGINYDDYSQFRLSLTPASGFQSAQFRHLELMCTPPINLVNENGRKELTSSPSSDEIFENIYWRDAGYDKNTGKSSYTLRAFEEKYLKGFKALTMNLQGHCILEQYLKFENPSDKLKIRMKDFDHHYNVRWPMVHLKTAAKYLQKKGKVKEATGGSDWKKYLHPKYQQRSFFPELWKEDDILNWV
ncbi:tryptophan 2,3-dioxygenase [Psychroflexus torquis ATCC 700755]|uniref:Tryptophan 2,3-dioxygenase n=1 Tax=Psychroflexus torquis (strain ATCC 700755 / CIP 106069 / ACAM 623) TaxID=313595 RepID=K4IC85_PSYTT|nr:tryptophan 2,3-dioxygenase family protein [Psychroflexus torquis]AFU67478.1 tryptophan 2,3-dioxygenase [Psychroflexus torquis ATCC 700755]